MESATNRRVRLAITMAVTATFVAALSACSEGGGVAGGGTGAENAGGPSVPFGASAEEWKEAFAEIDPIKIIVETAGSATAPSAQATLDFEKRVEELSDGKIDVEITWGLAISGSQTEQENSLMDGRVDLSSPTPWYEGQEYPFTGGIVNEMTILYPDGQIGGWLTGFGTAAETLWNTPEFNEEWAEYGLTPLTRQSSANMPVLACTEEVTSLADIEGLQIRVAPPLNFRQIEALGATPVSVPFTELFESVQRGIVDCILAGVDIIGLLPGLAEMLPFISIPDGTRFGGTTAFWLAGIRWADYPLAVQQLIFDQIAEIELRGIPSFLYDTPIIVHEQGAAVGGKWSLFDDDVNQKLAEFNATVEKEWASSSVADGAAMLAKWNETEPEWHALLEEAGISFAPLSDFDAWSKTEPDWDAFAEIYYERVVKPNRPS